MSDIQTMMNFASNGVENGMHMLNSYMNANWNVINTNPTFFANEALINLSPMNPTLPVLWDSGYVNLAYNTSAGLSLPTFLTTAVNAVYTGLANNLDATTDSIPADFAAQVWNAPTGLTQFDLSSIPAVNLPASPTLLNPTLPSLNMINNVAVDAGQSATATTTVALTNWSLPDPDTLNLPSFSTDAPAIDYLVPMTTFSWGEAAYSSNFSALLEAAMGNDITSGGFGLSANDTVALYPDSLKNFMESVITGDITNPEGWLTASDSASLIPGQLATVSANALQNDIETNSYGMLPVDYAAMYPDQLFTLIETLLSSDMNGGSCGIDPATEQALYERERDREAAAYSRNASELTRSFGARGFQVPPSVMLTLLNQAGNAYSAAMGAVNRDIALKRADMLVQARQFAIQSGINLEQAMLDIALRRSGMLVQARQTAIQTGVNLETALLDVALKRIEMILNVRETAVRNGISFEQSFIDLALKRASLFVQARQAAIAQGINFEQAVMNLFNSKMERGLAAGRFLQEMLFKQTDLQADRFKTTVALWKTHIDVIESWSELQIKQLTETYHLVLSKAELIDKGNNTQLQMVDTLNKAVDTVENIRKTNVDIARVSVEIEDLKLKESVSMVELFTSEWKANETMINAYVSEIEAALKVTYEPVKMKLHAMGQVVEQDKVIGEINNQIFQAQIESQRVNMDRSRLLLAEAEQNFHTVTKRIDDWKDILELDLREAKQMNDVDQANFSNALERRVKQSQIENAYWAERLGYIKSWQQTIIDDKSTNNTAIQMGMNAISEIITATANMLSGVATSAQGTNDPSV